MEAGLYWSYFDDSGKWKDSDYVCLAGYLSDESGWNGFCADWRALLDKHGIPSVHVKDLLPMQGPYRDLGWTLTKRDEVYNEFVSVIRKHVLVGFGMAVDARYWRAMKPEARKLLGDPFMACFQRLMRRITDRLEAAGSQDPMPITFDDCSDYSQKCYSAWSALRKRDPRMMRLISAITFADDEIFYPLQGADVLANETNKHLRNLAKARRVRPDMENLRPEMENLVRSLDDPPLGIEYVGELWDGPELERAYQAATATGARRVRSISYSGPFPALAQKRSCCCEKT